MVQGEWATQLNEDISQPDANGTRVKFLHFDINVTEL